MKNYGLPLAITVFIVLAVGLAIASGLLKRLQTAAENLPDALARLFARRDPTRYYLEKFVDDYKDPKFQSLKALARDVQMPELKDIYVPALMRMETAESEAGAKGGKGGGELLERPLRDQPKSVTLTDAVQEAPGHLALTGIAGSGKSTELQWAGVACAQAALGQRLSVEQRALVRALGKGRPLTPVFFPLGAFDRYCQQHKGGLRTAANLLEFAVTRFNKLHEKQPLSADFFKQRLRQGCLLLFDGVDEVEPDQRGTVRAAVQELLKDYAGPRTRALLTSRPAAYFGTAQAANFRKGDIQPLADGQRDALIRGLHKSMYPDDADKAARESRDLIRRIEASDEKVQELARTPLLSTIFALVHRAKRQLPEQRAELYEEAVITLLEESYRRDDAETGARASDADPNLRRDRLALVAFHLHDAGAGDEGMAENDLVERVWPAFGQDALTARAEASRFMHGIANRGGLLEEQDRRFGFRSHRTFQEFLAGRYLVRGYAPFDLQKQGEFLGKRLDDERWEEPARLAAGYLAIGGPGEAEQFIKMIFNLGGDDDAGDRATAIAGLALSDLPAAHLSALSQTRASLVKEMLNAFRRDPPRLELPLRRRLGLALAALSDPRFATPLCERKADALRNYLTAIPSGPFRMGTSDEEAEALKAQHAEAWDDEKPQHIVFVSEFRIGKYPITNADFRAFVDEGGYDPDRPHWQGEARAWRLATMEPDLSIYSEKSRESIANWLKGRPKEKRHQPFFWDDPQWNADNLPVVGVTWYEADAYCRWLTGQLRASGAIRMAEEVRLPTEAEWEKAARGPQNRLWPWGDTWDKGRCNSEESGFNATTPVGMYPDGASDYGVEDMIGNVWEWCGDWYDEELYQSREDQDVRDPPGPPSGKARVVRGGAWSSDRRLCRSAYRSWSGPAFFGSSLGLRVVCAPVRS